MATMAKVESTAVMSVAVLPLQLLSLPLLQFSSAVSSRLALSQALLFQVPCPPVLGQLDPFTAALLLLTALGLLVTPMGLVLLASPQVPAHRVVPPLELPQLPLLGWDAALSALDLSSLLVLLLPSPLAFVPLALLQAFVLPALAHLESPAVLLLRACIPRDLLLQASLVATLLLGLSLLLFVVPKSPFEHSTLGMVLSST